MCKLLHSRWYPLRRCNLVVGWDYQIKRSCSFGRCCGWWQINGWWDTVDRWGSAISKVSGRWIEQWNHQLCQCIPQATSTIDDPPTAASSKLVKQESIQKSQIVWVVDRFCIVSTLIVITSTTTPVLLCALHCCYWLAHALWQSGLLSLLLVTL